MQISPDPARGLREGCQELRTNTQRMLFHFWHPAERGTKRGKLGSEGAGERLRINMNTHSNKSGENGKMERMGRSLHE
jgi:hypothetical protein